MARRTRKFPPHVPNDEKRNQVAFLAASRAPEAFIARALECSLKELRSIYWDELENGSYIANAMIAQNIFSMAMNPNHPRAVQAAKLWYELSKEGELLDPSGEDAAEDNGPRDVQWEIVDPSSEALEDGEDQMGRMRESAKVETPVPEGKVLTLRPAQTKG